MYPTNHRHTKTRLTLLFVGAVCVLGGCRGTSPDPSEVPSSRDDDAAAADSPTDPTTSYWENGPEVGGQWGPLNLDAGLDAHNRPEVPIEEPTEPVFPPESDLEILSIVPASGPTGGGTSVIIVGRRFTARTDVFFGGEICAEIDVIDDTKIFCTTPPNPAGRATVKAIDDSDEVSLEGAFEYFAPVHFSHIEPDSGPSTGGMPVEIRGGGFTSNTAVSIGGRLGSTIEVLDDRTIRLLTPPGEPGWQTIRISNENGLDTVNDVFRYFQPISLGSVRPGVGAAAGGDTVEIFGIGFSDSGDVQAYFGLLEADVEAVSDTVLLATTPPGPAGTAADVEVVSDANGEYVLHDGFYYLAADAAPGIALIVPDSGATGGGYPVVLSGLGLHEVIDGGVWFGDHPAEIVDRGDNYLVVTAPAGAPGAVNVLVQFDAGPSAYADGFTYLAGIDIYTIDPAEGDISGGTPFVIAGEGFDPRSRVLFGGLPASELEITPTTIAGRTPVGVPGPTDVVVSAPGGVTGTLPRGFLYTVDMQVLGFSPASGSIAGGTVVVIRGAGFVDPLTVTFGEIEAAEVTLHDSASLSARTPPHEPQFVNVAVTRGEEVEVSPGRFLYYDPASIDWGSWGEEILGSVNVTVISDQGIPLPDAYVQLNIRGESVLSGVTDANGQVTISGPDLRGGQTVSATRLGFNSATVQSVNASNITVVLSCVPDGQCFAPTDCRDGFDCTCGPPFQAPGMCLVERFCGTEIQTQEQFDAMCVSEYEEPPLGVITGQLTGLHKIVDPEPYERIMGTVVTTQPHPFISSSISAGSGNSMEDDGPYTLQSRVGEIALVAMCGVQNDEENVFTPMWIGVRRGLFIVEGMTYEIDIECDIRLTEELTIKAVNPPFHPPDGPDNLRHRPWLHFGSEGYYGFTEIKAETDEIVTACCYPPLTGDLAGVEYSVVGGAYRGYGSPRSIALVDGLRSTEDVFVLPEFTPVVILTTPASGEPLLGRYLEWGLTSDALPDYYDLDITDARDPRTVYWSVLVPGEETMVNLPYWPAGTSSGIFPPTTMLLIVRAVNAISFDFDNFGANDFSFMNRRSYSIQYYLLDNSGDVPPGG